MSGIRPLTEADIPAVVALRRRCFAQSAHTSDEALGRYIHKLCFNHPWPRQELPSLVYEAKDGSIGAFLGVLPRPMQYQGERLWMAVSSQFMVDPAQSGLVAIKLLKTFLAGPQDFSMSDLVNDNSRKVWLSLGAKTVYAYSQNWNRSFRPLAADAARAGGGRLPLALIRLADQVSLALPGSRFKVVAGNTQSEAVDAAWMAQHADELCAHSELTPDYTEASYNWLLDQVRLDASVAELVLQRVVDDSGATLGSYLFTVKKDGLADLVQLLAMGGEMPRVVKQLMVDASLAGALALNGRFEPDSLRALAPQPLALASSGPWMMLDSKRPELREDILAGGATLSRLEGEWWMGF